MRLISDHDLIHHGWTVHQTLIAKIFINMKQQQQHRKKGGEGTSVSPSSTSSSSSHFNRKTTPRVVDDETSASSSTTTSSNRETIADSTNARMASLENVWYSRGIDVLVFTFVILGFASLSIFVGVAAGISISIYHFEGLESDHRRLVMGYYGIHGYNVRQMLVTHYDTSIAAIHGDTVLVTTKDGGTAMFPVVQESPMNSTQYDYTYPSPKLQWEDFRTEHPRPCRTNPNVLGYQSYAKFKRALFDVNRYSAERHDRWTEFLERSDDSYYYQEEITLTICPGTVLYGFYGPLFVNTESLTIQCDGCTISSWGSHMAFGPSARNVRLLGLTFRHATAPSMSFPYDGADVTFEHCRWRNNSTGKPHQGSVLDMNSSSGVHFFRCFVSQPMGGWRRGYQTAALSIRQK